MRENAEGNCEIECALEPNNGKMMPIVTVFDSGDRDANPLGYKTGVAHRKTLPGWKLPSQRPLVAQDTGHDSLIFSILANKATAFSQHTRVTFRKSNRAQHQYRTYTALTILAQWGRDEKVSPDGECSDNRKSRQNIEGWQGGQAFDQGRRGELNSLNLFFRWQPDQIT